jgi:hypothetical protein
MRLMLCYLLEMLNDDGNWGIMEEKENDDEPSALTSSPRQRMDDMAVRWFNASVAVKACQLPWARAGSASP